ncbi:MAG: hypothetical protein JWQ66_3270 [Mucilaginibacter sp.]|nr:hypothetical protein [Mucilaginibacter sp.]
MKNPFEKNDHKLLIAGIVIGSAAAGAVAYLFLTETGSQVRQQLTGHFGRMRDAFLGNRSEEPQSDSQAYLKHKGKEPKTDREALLKGEIQNAPNAPDPDGKERQQS